MNRFGSLLCASILLSASHNAESQQQRNVLVLMADDMNYWTSALGYYPSVKTPVIDSLAAKGVLFMDAHCSSPACVPSRNALWSGFRPSTTGITTNQDGFVREKAGFEEIVTMNQYFKENGYFTYGAGKLWHPPRMGATESDPKNWTVINPHNSGCEGGNLNRYTVSVRTGFRWSANPDPLSEDNCNDYVLANHVANLLSSYHLSPLKDDPFFIACGFFRPHMPWNTPVEFWDEFDPEEIVVPPPAFNDEPGNQVHQEIVANGKWKQAIHAYLASIRLTDHNIGIVLDALFNSPYANNTIVVVMGDHGWHLGEKGVWGKQTTWNEANQTTLIIYDPLARGNGEPCHKVVSLQDIYPTLIELAGLPPKTNIEGRSLKPLLDEPGRDDWNWPVFMTQDELNYIKTNEFRFVERGASSRLFDIKEDPYEWYDLYGQPQYNSIVEYLRFQMDSILAIGSRLKHKLLSDYSFTPAIHSLPGILEAEDYDEGASQQTYFDSTENNAPGFYREDGVDIDITDDPRGGGFHITETEGGEWLQYTISSFERGIYDIHTRVRNKGAETSSLVFYINGRKAGAAVVDQTNESWHYVTIEDVEIKERTGYLVMRVEFEGAGIDVNYFSFVHKETVNSQLIIRDNGGHRFLLSNIINDGYLNLDLTPTNPMAKIQLYDMMGRKLQEDYVGGEVHKLYPVRTSLSKGYYLVRISDGHWDRVEKFLVK